MNKQPASVITVTISIGDPVGVGSEITTRGLARSEVRLTVEAIRRT